MAADPASVDRAAALIERFLDGRTDRTRQAYAIDIEEFARFRDCVPADALARLLRDGSQAGRALTLEYAMDLRRRGRAGATITRRLGTLRALVRAAGEAGLVQWSLETPSDAQVSRVMEDDATGKVPYLLPRHPSEIHRLDVQHYALQAAVGKNYLAPVDAPARVLDVGCGTGQWAFDVCEEFPDALAVGIDLVPGKPERPPGYRWVRANLLAGLPLGDGRFDFVHQRFLVSGVPLVAWPGVVAELVRVARPGGWVELTESVMHTEGLGPASERLIGLARTMAGSLGLDTGRVVHDSIDAYLRQAGAANVVRQELALPIGRWGGPVGSLVAADMRAACSRLCEVLQARSQLTAEESSELLRRAQEEWEQYRPEWTVAIAWGQRPD